MQGSSLSSSSSSPSSCSGGSKEDDLVLSSSQDSSSPGPHSVAHHHLQLGLGLTLSPSSSSSFSTLSSRTNVISRTNTPHSLLPPSQVVGWPPLGTHRMNSFNSHVKSQANEVFNSVVQKSKSNGAMVRKSVGCGSDNNHLTLKEKGNLRSSLFVKVNMDGVPIGRKVDLSAYTSYENLAQALEDMFNEPTAVITRKVPSFSAMVLTSSSVGSNGEGHGIVFVADGQSKSLDGSSNFVLTYKDKEGDWMLVGDVPWWMFLTTVRRLRIMRTYEANGIAPRMEEKNSRLKNEFTWIWFATLRGLGYRKHTI